MKKNIFILFLLTSVATMFGQTTTIVVKDAGGFTVQGATVNVDGGAAKTTGSSGSISFYSSDGVTAGAHTVNVTTSCHSPASQGFTVTGTTSQTVTVTLSTTVTGSMTVGTYVNGVATYDPDLKVVLTRSTSNGAPAFTPLTMTSNGDGTYSAPNLNFGSYTVTSSSNTVGCRATTTSTYNGSKVISCDNLNPFVNTNEVTDLTQVVLPGVTTCGGVKSLNLLGAFFQNNKVYDIAYTLNGTPGVLTGLTYSVGINMTIPGAVAGDTVVLTTITNTLGGCTAIPTNLPPVVMEAYNPGTTATLTVTAVKGMIASNNPIITVANVNTPTVYLTPSGGFTNSRNYDNVPFGDYIVTTYGNCYTAPIVSTVTVDCAGLIAGGGVVKLNVDFASSTIANTVPVKLYMKNGVNNIIDPTATAQLKYYSSALINGVWNVDHFDFDTSAQSVKSNQWDWIVNKPCYPTQTAKLNLACNVTWQVGITSVDVNVNFANIALTCTPIEPASCGITLDNIQSYAYCALVKNAQSYTWEVTNVATNQVETRTTVLRNLKLPFLSNFAYDTQYSIRVASTVAGVLGAYGPACLIRTPVATTTLSTCGGTVATKDTWVYANIVQYAKGYQFKVTNANDDLDTQTVNSALRNFRFSQLSGFVAGAQYNVTCRVQNTDGTYLPEGPACTITAPAATGRFSSSNVATATNFNVVSYPNPFTNDFRIDVTSISQEKVQINVYDMVGRLVENRVSSLGDLQSTRIGNNYQAGIYNVVVSQADNTQTIRIVKK